MSKKADSYSQQRRCRILKTQGYTDEQLIDEGFDRNTIQRAVLSVGGRRGSTIQTGRCGECGGLYYYLKQYETCKGCKQKAEMQSRTRVDKGIVVEKPVVVASPLSVSKELKKPASMEHPMLLKSK